MTNDKFLKDHLFVCSIPDSPKQYVLKANSNEGIIYYMNVMMFTGQKEYAQEYSNLADAEKDMEYFKVLVSRIKGVGEFEIVEK